MKKKAKPKPSTSSPNRIVIFGGSLLVGVLIGIAAVAAYDYFADRQKNSTIQDPNTEFVEEVTLAPTNTLPANFPPDFPIYPGSELKTSWTVEGDIKEGISVLWESKDSPVKVSNYYKLSLPENGWEVESSFESEGSYTISFKRQGAEGFIGITRGGGDLSLISVTVGVELISI